MSINSIWVGDTAGVGLESLCGVDKILFATSSTEGTLFIDLIDAKKKELVWQAKVSVILTKIRG
jgi:hypothetical protein